MALFFDLKLLIQSYMDNKIIISIEGPSELLKSEL